MTSHDLLRKWSRERDELAFRELVQRHAPMVFATSKRILRDDTEAQDVTQECFETLATTRRLPDSNLGPWLHRVATNRCLDRLRTTGRRAKREIDFATRQLQPHATGWNDIYDLVDEAIAELPDKYRTVIIAHFLEGRPQTDIANELHLTRQAVHERLNRGIEAVRASLKRRGVEISAVTLGTLLLEKASAVSITPALTASLGKLALSANAAGASNALSTFSSIGLGTWIAGTAATLLLALGVLWIQVKGSSSDPVPPPAASVAEMVSAIAGDGVDSDDSADAVSPIADYPETSDAPVVMEIESTSEQEAEASTSQISGVVLRADDLVFPHANITFAAVVDNKSAYDGRQTTADEEGLFQISGLATGEYSIHVSPPGVDIKSVFFEVSRITLKDDELIQDLKLIYGKEGKFVLAGTVSDTSNHPIAGVLVAANAGPKVFRTALSNERGAFLLEFLPEGKREIVALDQSGKFCELEATAQAGDTNVRLILERTVAVEGQVVQRKDSQPIENFYVTARQGHAEKFSDALLHRKSAVSVSEGRFRIEDLPSGDLTVTAWADGFSPEFIHTRAVDGATASNLLIKLAPGPTITGNVVNEQGMPVPAARIYLGEVGTRNNLHNKVVAAVTDDAGDFTVPNIPDVDSIGILVAEAEGYALASEVLSSKPISIVLKRPATLTVSVREAGKPLADIPVSILFEPDTGFGLHEVLRTDSNGILTDANMPPGPMRISVSRSNPSNAWIERYLLLKAGEEHTLTLEFAPATASLEGKVTWRGETPDLLQVYALVDTATGTEKHEARAENDGTYWFEELPAGTAAVRAYARINDYSSCSSIHENVELLPGNVTRDDFILTGPGRVEGRISGVNVRWQSRVIAIAGKYTLGDFMGSYIFGERPEFATFASGDTDETGYYAIRYLEPGDYTLVAFTYTHGVWGNPTLIGSTQVRIVDDQPVLVDF